MVLFQNINIFFIFFDNADLYALQISICSNNFRGEPESNPGTTEDKPTAGLSNRAQPDLVLMLYNL